MCKMCSGCNNYDIIYIYRATPNSNPIEGSSQKARKVDFCTLRQTPFFACQVCRGLPPLAKGPVQQAALSLQEAHVGSVGKNDSRGS